MYIDIRLFSKVVDWNGTSLSCAMYCPNSNRILVTKINLLTIVNKFLNNSRLHMQATTIKLAWALRSPIKKDPQLRLPFQIMVLCVIHTTMVVRVASSCKNNVDDSLLITSNKGDMLTTLLYLWWLSNKMAYATTSPIVNPLLQRSFKLQRWNLIWGVQSQFSWIDLVIEL